MQRTNMFKSASRNSQLLLLDQKCAKCLLETYVKRSLSLNEGCRKHKQKRLNRVKRDERESQARRASSDTSTHRLSVEKHLKISKCTECTTSAFDLRCESPKGPSKTKRHSLFRGFLNRFSKKKSDLKVNGEGVSETDCGQSTIERGIGHSKSLRKKHSLKKILFSNQNDEQRDFTLVPCGKEGISDEEGSFEDVDQKRLPLDVAPKFMLPKPGQSRLRSPGFSPLPPARLAAFGSVRSASVSSVSSNQSNDSAHSDLCRSSLSVGSSNAYFETVSEELESIVKKIQFSPKDDPATLPSAACLEDYRSAGDDTTERIISLLKQHGDIIDQKISKNKSVQDFLQKLTYSSFQQLADHYVAEIPSPLPQTTDASPELVRLAFTLDFTAKVAGLCSQTVGRIMGFGYQYLQDSFTQMCAAHRQVPEDLEGQNNCDPD